jgi:hypothetical protein
MMVLFFNFFYILFTILHKYAFNLDQNDRQANTHVLTSLEHPHLGPWLVVLECAGTRPDRYALTRKQKPLPNRSRQHAFGIQAI